MYTKESAEKKLEALFDALVPATGTADTVAGEIVRAICRIGYRKFNDGDRLGVGYGRETCNPAGRYLAKKCDANVARRIADIWGIHDDDVYDMALVKLEIAVCKYLDAHPELQTTPSSEDMWSYRDSDEDVDNADDYEDEDYYDLNDYDDDADWD